MRKIRNVNKDNIEMASELWDTMIEYVPVKDRESAAEHYIIVLRRLDFLDDEIFQVGESSTYLANVIEAELEEEELHSDYDDDEDE
jgi:hypothetical protein